MVELGKIARLRELAFRTALDADWVVLPPNDVFLLSFVIPNGK